MRPGSLITRGSKMQAQSESGGTHAGGNRALAIANMREVFRVGDVRAKADKTVGHDNGPLLATYNKMLEVGPNRFQVKPSTLPSVDYLFDDLPNFHEVIDDVHRQLSLCIDSGDPLEIAPILLLGPAGIGKTNFAKALSVLLGTGFGFISMSSLTAGWILSGSSSQWRGAKPGKVFETLIDGQYANPVMLLDEIDKARAEHAYDPLGSLYCLLEHDTASSFTDEFAEIPIDASQLIWIATANDERSIPRPILDRMNVYEVEAPDADAARVIARRLYESIRSEHAWGLGFQEEPRPDVLDAMATMSPREIRKAWAVCFGNAKLAGRDHVCLKDLPTPRVRSRLMGFVQ